MNAKIAIGIIVVLFVAIFAEDYFRTKWAQDLIQKEKDRIIEQYEYKIKVKEGEIRDLQKKLEVSTKQYKDLKEQIEKKELEVQNVTPPASRAELVDRYRALGYPVVDNPCLR